MATKWKNYNLGFRLLAIFLVIVSAVSCSYFALISAENYILFDISNSEQYYDAPFFKENINKTAASIASFAQYHNAEFIKQREAVLDEYNKKSYEAKKEQQKLELLLDEMLWLQQKFPYDEKYGESLDPNIFINCTEPEDYVVALKNSSEAAENENFADDFYEYIKNGGPDRTAVGISADHTSKDTSSDDSAAQSETSAPSPEPTTSLNAAEETFPEATVPVTAAEDDEESSYEPYYNENDSNIGTVKNPSGYSSELPGYKNTAVWLYYYYTIRTYLVEKTGTPVYSENIYGYAASITDSLNQIKESDEYRFINTSVPNVTSIKYLFVYDKTGEYVTNIKEYIPNGKKMNEMQTSGDIEAVINSVKKRASASDWQMSVTPDGVSAKQSAGNTPGENYSSLIFDSSYDNLSSEDLGGSIYLYSDLETTKDYSFDIFSFCYKAFNKAKDNHKLFFAIAVISAAVFALTALYILIAGTKKKTAIDKLYNDWHFILSAAFTAAAVIGAVVTATYVMDGMSDVSTSDYISFTVCRYLFPLLVAVTLLILLEYITSVIRSARNAALIKHSFWYAAIMAIIGKIKKLKETRFDRSIVYYKKLYIAVIAIGAVYITATTLLCGISTELWGAAPTAAIGIAILIMILRHIKALDLLNEATEKIRGGDYSVNIDMRKIPDNLKPLAANILHTRDGIKNAVEQSVRDERMKTELITNVSHDLKTPLTSIVTYADLLKKCDIEDEKANGFIGIIGEKADKLKRLIEDLVEASKASTGNIVLHRMNINLHEMALQAVGEYSDVLEQAKIETIMNDPEKDVIVFADNRQTWRVIDNLFSNVKKYAMPGTRVYVEVREIGGKGVFKIKNISKQPLNIPAEELTRRFVRGDDSRSGEGSGLGLSIARSLCEIQNGAFEIDIDGDMFTATVTLPKAYTKTDAPAPEEKPAEVKNPAVQSPTGNNSSHVLAGNPYVKKQ